MDSEGGATLTVISFISALTFSEQVLCVSEHCPTYFDGEIKYQISTFKEIRVYKKANK